MHRILLEQIRRCFGGSTTIPAEWKTFLELVNDTYVRLDKGCSLQVSKRTEDLDERVLELEDARMAAANLLADLQEEQRALAEAKAKDEAILASIADGCIVVNEKGEIVLINEAAQKMLGYTKQESIGKLWHEILYREDENGNFVLPEKGAIFTALSTTTTTTTTTKTSLTLPGIYYYVRKNKTKFPVAITVAPVILENRIIGAIEVFRDITKEREVDKAKTEFVSLASHQLRTPLTTINWYIEMLQSADAGLLNNQQKEYLTEVYKGSRRMVQLVNDLLNVSRLETGRLKIKPVPTDLIAFIREVRKEVEPMVQETGCRVSLEFPEKKIAEVNIDKVLLRQVIVNLLTNAISYSSVEKKGRVIVSLKVDSKEYTITVKDNGIGIPKEAQGRIWEKFFRADNARSVVADGNGLGLYLTKQIIESSGCTMGFTSESGKGATFYVAIPVSGMTSKEGEKGLEA